MSARLFEAYIRQSLVGLAVGNDEVVRVTIYGAVEEFRVEVPVESYLEELSLADSSAKRLITKEYIHSGLKSPMSLQKKHRLSPLKAQLQPPLCPSLATSL